MDYRFKPYVGMIGQEFILLSGAIMALSKAKETQTLQKWGMDAMKQHGEFLLARATELDLPMSKNKAATLLHYVMNNANALEVRTRARELMETMKDEVFFVQFLPVPANRLKYTEVDPFGPTVAAKFNSATYDIAEAGMCYACGRWTATVMHCMRILEFGLDALGEALKVKRGTRGWGQDLNNFSAKWDNTVKSWKKGMPSLGWRRLLFPKLFAEFRHFEFAWRNHAIHAHANYGEIEAGRVFEHVQSFMQLLSERLRESKKRRLKS